MESFTLKKKKKSHTNVACCNEFQENHRKMVIGSGVANCRFLRKLFLKR